MATVTTKTSKSEMTRAAIVGAALDIALQQGLEAISLQAVADRVGLSKSGVFSRVGSREALQSAVIEEYDRRFLGDVFVPAMQAPKGLPRLCAMVRRWIERVRVVEANSGCLYTAGAFELDDREGPLREQLLRGVLGWRAALRRVVLQAVEQGHLRGDCDVEQTVGEIYSMMIGMVHDARFMRDPRAAERTHTTFERLMQSLATTTTVPFTPATPGATA
ncbi:MAG: TetR/AcrR family transcriptional regulator [Burkholderiales bacterium]